MRRVRRLGWGASAVLLAAASGCGLAAPGPRPAPRIHGGPPPAAIRRAARTHELVTGPPPRVGAAGWWASPSGAIEAFAEAYVNWSWHDVVAKLRALAAVSVGPARSEMEMSAAQAAADPSLRGGDVVNRGTVEAVAPLGRDGLWVVVTREQTSSLPGTAYAGTPPAWHVTLTRATALARGEWVVSAWQPQS